MCTSTSMITVFMLSLSPHAVYVPDRYYTRTRPVR